MVEFAETWSGYRERTEHSLGAVFAALENVPARLLDGMKYATLDGGKRLRAMLVYAAGEHLRDLPPAPRAVLDTAAVAVELVHAYSLVHDDLPAMDDDDLRRGRPTCHRAFDEATAILVGDALQSLAFEQLSGIRQTGLPPDRSARMVLTLARAIGGEGMAGGQSLDMEATRNAAGLAPMERMHRMKTGALIRASCTLGGLAVAGIPEQRLAALDRFGEAIGVAFQIVDDILDVTADSETLGKRSGADDRMQKSTFVSLLGLDGARQQRDAWHGTALETADVLGDNGSLFHQLADFVVNRSY